VIVDIGGIDDHHCSNIILKDISGLLKRRLENLRVQQYYYISTS
jgi:hypothetical protein